MVHKGDKQLMLINVNNGYRINPVSWPKQEKKI